MIVQKIKNDRFYSFIDWVNPKYQNLNPVFVATYNLPNVGLVTAYSKIYQLSADKRSLINEIVGYLFASALGIPQPEYAFLAEIPTTHLRDVAVKYPQFAWLTKLNYYPAFCTSRLDGETAGIFLGDVIHTQAKVQTELNKWKALPNAVTLDENIAHTDRHLNNLIRIRHNEYATIDNGRLICDISDDWQCTMLAPKKHYTNKLSQMACNHSPSNDQVSTMLSISEKHQNAFEQIQDELIYWAGQLIPNNTDRSHFLSFIQDRTGLTKWLIEQRYHRLI
ncbi:hypothetical protein SAMN05421749_103285 [Acinetobacter marinus]|uniref:Uncharacterized protein n=1 Tax=Acinetobacter marinus TaxID=281375 RepID=A0A1G6JC14_9GAMM|nr:hypothetical protein [Acinetobacter marinus]SDC15436.1 hypothetical protein SAMN05421749_103285 [Acinetobacter marinus]